MECLIDILKSCNLKERFFLLAQALDQHSGAKKPKEPEFKIDDKFLTKLCCKLCLKKPDADKVFIAMDYHLDSIAASLRRFHCGKSAGDNFKNIDEEGCVVIEGTQRDVDLLVAFPSAEADAGDVKYHLILIEAKAYSPWKDDDNFKNKIERLKQIFGNCGDKYSRVEPRFLFISKDRPQNLSYADWPCWMLEDKGKPHHLELKLPPAQYRVKRYAKGVRHDKDGRSKESYKSFHFRHA